MNKIVGYIVGAFIAALLSGCQGEPKETATRGVATLTVAEAIAPLMKKEEETFEDLYKDAQLTIHVALDREAIAYLLNDSVKAIAVARPLNAEERDVQKRFNIDLYEYKFAIDAVAVIVHPQNPITQLRTTELDSILRGTVSRWNQIGWKASDRNIELYLPNRNSSAYQTVEEKILHGGEFTLPAGVTDSSLQMIRAVARNSSSIGLVNLVWLRDYEDSVKVLALSDPNAPDSLGIEGQFFTPHQAYVYQGFYPIRQDVYLYAHDEVFGPAAGFMSFVNSGPGQKIVLNSGLVPATMPVRLVEVTRKDMTP